jgi:hypothetical protein
MVMIITGLSIYLLLVKGSCLPQGDLVDSLGSAFRLIKSV